MAASRCPDCDVLLLAEEAAGPACPACGAVFGGQPEPAKMPSEPPPPPPRRPWGMIAAVAVLSLLVLVLLVSRPSPTAVVPPDQTGALTLLAAKQAAESEAETASAEARKLKNALTVARKDGERLRALEKKLAALGLTPPGSARRWKRSWPARQPKQRPPRRLWRRSGPGQARQRQG